MLLFTEPLLAERFLLLEECLEPFLEILTSLDTLFAVLAPLDPLGPWPMTTPSVGGPPSEFFLLDLLKEFSYDLMLLNWFFSISRCIFFLKDISGCL